MVFGECARDFLTYCEPERALSRNTIIAYGDDLKRFSAFAAPLPGTPFGPNQISKTHVRACIASQRERGLAIPTIQRRTHCLRSFWALLADSGIETRESPLEASGCRGKCIGSRPTWTTRGCWLCWMPPGAG